MIVAMTGGVMRLADEPLHPSTYPPRLLIIITQGTTMRVGGLGGWWKGYFIVWPVSQLCILVIG